MYPPINPPSNLPSILNYLLLCIGLSLTTCQPTSSPPTATTRSTPTPNTPVIEVTQPPISTTQPTIRLSPQPTIQPTAHPANLPTGGTAILGLVGQTDSLNPITDSNAALRELAPLLFDSLLTIDPQTARLQPGLAQSWEYSADGRQVIFHLPNNLRWSDGTSLNASTIADSLAATRHPALLSFSNIDAPADDTLALTFIKIDCAAVTNLALLPLLPAAEITATVPTGSGPFVVEAWSANKRSMTLAQNPNYWDDSPLLDGFVIRFFQEDEAAIALSEGEFDAVGPFQTPSLPPNRADFADLTYPAPQMVYLALNFDPKNGEPMPLELRQALLLALDRQAILDEVLDGDGQLLAGPLLPNHWAANPNLTLPAYDPDAAHKLLAAAGLRDRDGDGWLDLNGERLELGIRLNGQNELYQNLGWLLSSYYRDLGLFVRAESVAFDSVVDDLFTHDFNLAIFRWPFLPDPDQRLFWRSTENKVGLGLNFTSYNNPQLDDLLDEAVGVPGCEPTERAEIYADMQQTLASERPVDFLLTPNRHLLVGNRLQGVSPGPFASFTWNASTWYLENE